MMMAIEHGAKGELGESARRVLAAGEERLGYRGIEGDASGMSVARGILQRFIDGWLLETESGATTLGLDVRMYREMWVPKDGRHIAADQDPPYLLCVWWTPAPGEVGELEKWYSEEHIPNLWSIPGWGRIHRYERVAGRGPLFLAVHQLLTLEVFSDPGYVPAVQTPWWNRVKAQRLEYDRCVMQLDK